MAMEMELPILFSGIESALQQAFKLNAEMLFERFDARLFQMYIRVHWDTCSISPPAAIVGAMRRWLTQTMVQQTSGIEAQEGPGHGLFQILSFGEDVKLQNLFTVPSQALPPQMPQLVGMSSFEALRSQADSVLDRGIGSLDGNTNMLLRLMAGLVSAKILEEGQDMVDASYGQSSASPRISRGQAWNTACAIRTSMYLNSVNVGDERLEALPSDVDLLRTLVAIREYAQVEIDPQCIFEMWSLEDALTAAGEHEKALDVRRKAYSCLEDHLKDVPADVV
ncbi:hypothetical protein ANO11243_095980 [Dothideomycetidae sp. 11243]|nr:hypothetical protein ANO11243_095980 [fungal sp. No.11243]